MPIDGCNLLVYLNFVPSKPPTRLVLLITLEQCPWSLTSMSTLLRPQQFDMITRWPKLLAILALVLLVRPTCIFGTQIPFVYNPFTLWVNAHLASYTDNGNKFFENNNLPPILTTNADKIFAAEQSQSSLGSSQPILSFST